MGQNSQNCTPIANLERQLAEQETICKACKSKLEEVRAEALQKQFDLTNLNHANFFQKRFGNLRKKKEAAWAQYQAVVIALEQAKMDLHQANQQLAALRAEYEALTARE